MCLYDPDFKDQQASVIRLYFYQGLIWSPKWLMGTLPNYTKKGVHEKLQGWFHYLNQGVVAQYPNNNIVMKTPELKV